MGKLTIQESHAEYLRGLLPPDAELAIELIKRSDSGLTRYYRVYVAIGHRVESITGAVGSAAGMSTREICGRWAVVVRGCGFSGEDKIASNLSRALGRDVKYRDL